MERRINIAVGILVAILVFLLVDRVVHAIDLYQSSQQRYGAFDPAQGKVLAQQLKTDCMAALASLGSLAIWGVRAMIRKAFWAALGRLFGRRRKRQPDPVNEETETDDVEDEPAEPVVRRPRHPVRDAIQRARKRRGR